jgi:hypothetical protein
VRVTRAEDEEAEDFEEEWVSLASRDALRAPEANVPRPRDPAWIKTSLLGRQVWVACKIEAVEGPHASVRPDCRPEAVLLVPVPALLAKVRGPSLRRAG